MFYLLVSYFFLSNDFKRLVLMFYYYFPYGTAKAVKRTMCLLGFLEMQNQKQPTNDSKSLENRQDKSVIVVLLLTF